jgi:hypothetical protein
MTTEYTCSTTTEIYDCFTSIIFPMLHHIVVRLHMEILVQHGWLVNTNMKLETNKTQGKNKFIRHTTYLYTYIRLEWK